MKLFLTVFIFTFIFSFISLGAVSAHHHRDYGCEEDCNASPSATIDPCQYIEGDYEVCPAPSEEVTPEASPSAEPTVEPTAPPAGHGDGLSDGRSDGRSDGLSSPQAVLGVCTANTCGWK